MENKTYYLYYNIIDNTYCIDSKEFNSEDGYDKIYKNFANIGKIELTDQEVSGIKASSNDRVYIKKENKEARKIIYGKAEGRIDFDKVQKVIAQLCYNFKVDENYKYNFKEEEKEIQIEEERNENREITTEGEKTNIYLIEYKKFEELCNNLLEIINNPPFKSEELNTKFLINYTVGLENIIINEIIKIGKDKEKTYLLLSYFSKKLLDVYDKIKETENYGKVIYINCLFSIYDKILKIRCEENENLKNNIWKYARFFKTTIEKIITKEEEQIIKDDYRHFYIYKKDKKESIMLLNMKMGKTFWK